MRKFGFAIGYILLIFSTTLAAQENNDSDTMDKESYYEQLSRQDAAFEQSLDLANEDDEKDIWKDQKKYEKDLRKRDKEAYRAYMKGKHDAYAEHAEHCGSHCQHSEHYYQHAHFYFSYSDYHYPRHNNVAIRTGVQIASPRIGVSIF